MTALALTDDQSYWDETQLAVLQGSGIDEDVTRAELTAFLHECQRRRLDPFTRQIYLLGRWDSQKGRKVYRSQTSIDGFRLIARRAADEAEETIEYEDTLWCGADGKWTDIWLADEPPAASKLVVLRGGKRFPATARYSGYVQVNKQDIPVGLWKKMPDNQLAKCAEALALRKAFPEELGSLYTEEEMAQADNPQYVHATVVKDTPAIDQGVTDQEWLASALARAATFTDPVEGRKVHAEIGERLSAGTCSKADADEITSVLKARNAELTTAADTAPVEGVVVPALDPDDPWSAKIDELATAEDVAAAQEEVKAAIKDKSLDLTHANRILAAIDAKAASLPEQVAA